MLEIRDRFPILKEKINGKPFVYLDSAATSQRLDRVSVATTKYSMEINGNIHRGAHKMANLCTSAYENVREQMANFIGSDSKDQVIFTKGTTEGINMIAYSYGTSIEKGDIIVISEMEHHANIVPWQMLTERTGAKIKTIPFSDCGELDIERYREILSEGGVKIVAVNHISNVLGTVNPIKQIIDLAHDSGAIAVIDGAQAVAHKKVDVKELDCDFYLFSGHKAYGPTGTGVLYGKREHLDSMPPFMGGGEMIESVTFAKTDYNTLPYKFEPGTPNYTSVIALGEAISFIEEIGHKQLESIEQELYIYAIEKLRKIEGFREFGNSRNKAAIISFEIKGVHIFDLGTMLDNMGIAVRTGRMCTDPIMDRYGIEGVIRASFAPYNTKEEVDIFINSLNRILLMLR